MLVCFGMHFWCVMWEPDLYLAANFAWDKFRDLLNFKLVWSGPNPCPKCSICWFAHRWIVCFVSWQACSSLSSCSPGWWGRRNARFQIKVKSLITPFLLWCFFMFLKNNHCQCYWMHSKNSCRINFRYGFFDGLLVKCLNLLICWNLLKNVHCEFLFSQSPTSSLFLNRSAAYTVINSETP